MSIVNRCGEGFVGQLHSGTRHRANISMMHIAAVVGKSNAVLCQTVFIVAHEVRLPGATASAAACLEPGRSPCFGAHRIRPQLECSTALGLNHTIIVLASPLIDIPLNLLSSTSTERQPGSPSERGLAMFPAVSSLCLELFGERAVAYFSFTKLVRSFTVARAGLHFVFLRFSYLQNGNHPCFLPVHYDRTFDCS